MSVSLSIYVQHCGGKKITFANEGTLLFLYTEMQPVTLASQWESLGVTSDSQMWCTKNVHCTLLVGMDWLYVDLKNQPFVFHDTNTEWIEGENNFILINNFISKMVMSHSLQASKCKDFWQKNLQFDKGFSKSDLISVELYQGSLVLFSRAQKTKITRNSPYPEVFHKNRHILLEEAVLGQLLTFVSSQAYHLPELWRQRSAPLQQALLLRRDSTDCPLNIYKYEKHTKV